MVQLTLGTKRTALALYGVLLVLPTLVLGGLHWRQLVIDHETMLATVPGDAQNATRRLQETIQSQLRELVDREDERPFFEYRPSYFPPGTLGTDIALVPSPIKSGPTPHAILGWFMIARGRDPVILVGSRHGAALEQERQNEILYATLELKRRQRSELPYFWGFIRERRVRELDVGLPILAINLSDEESIDCMRDEMPALRGLQNEKHTIQVSAFYLRFYVESNGTPRLVATRKITVPNDKRLAQMPSCFSSLGRGVELEQGFFIDPTWFFHDLPATQAARVLDVSQVFVPMDAVKGAQDPNLESFAIHPVRALGFEASKEDEDYGIIKVAVNVRDLEARFRTQSVRFLGVAAMLVVSLATGLILLMRSVNRDLEAARRTENFVAAVTHELRTPVSAIKLYGEMLQDGWVDDPEKLKEYYRRIVRECGRLETLVENVLEKSQLARRDSVPEAGDLNAIVESLSSSLTSPAPDGIKDLEFHYGADLPRVVLLPDGVRSIVSNLVENARKYAPVTRDAANGESIVVKTHMLAGSVVLDVMDRGPGIPHSERARIFEAFYRMGNERTRTARGTGLGLHLVALQCTAMNARVVVLDRKGGGSVFRVTFETHHGAPDAA